MTGDRTIPAMLLTMFLVLAIPVGLYFRTLPAPALTPSEKELAKFSSQTVAMSSAQPPKVYSGLACPVTASPKKPDMGTGEKTVRTVTATPGTTKRVKPEPPRSLGSLPVVSMISFDGSTRTAIIDNRVVTEGSELDGGKIIKIEENRVLMRKTGKNVWLTIE